jgi:sigma-E factor negative regulatory protein RseA
MPPKSPVSPFAAGPLQSTGEVWSALADGEASERDFDDALAACRDAGTRDASLAAWHAYHLIGDALRSSDLAADRTRDRRLLEAVRRRLADEPVVLAPAASARLTSHAQRRRWRAWSGGAAVAAGVGLVGVMVWLTQAPGSLDSASTLSRANPAGIASPAGSATLVSESPAPVGTGTPTDRPAPLAAAVGAGPMLRDARIDEYLAAHRQLGAGRPLGTPAGYAVDRAAAGPR